MKYTIVTHYDEEVLAAKVEDLIAEGWTPQGGVSVAVNGQSNNVTFAQALVKESK